MIVFYTQKDGTRLGTVKLVDGLLVATGAADDLVNEWSGSAAAFMKRYSKWANGYIYTQEES